MSIMESIAAHPRPFVLALVTTTTGEAPGKTGFKMLVNPDGSAEGTVGGGDVELQATRAALEMMRDRQVHRVETYQLNQRPEASGTTTTMICGGSATIYFELFSAARRALLFGGGHVAQQLAPLLAGLGMEVVVLDNRPDYATPDRYPSGTAIRTGDYRHLARTVELDAGCHCFIFTHGHSHDAVVLKELIHRDGDWGYAGAYLGMIGSAKKVGQLLDRLREEGAPAELLQQVFTPIGLEIGGQTPFEIALGIAAEVLAVTSGKPAHHMRDRRGRNA